MIFYNPPLTGKAGRPRSPFCKRGHPRVVGEAACVGCRRLRERAKYAANEVFRDKKKAYQSQYRAEFFAKNGFHACDQYENQGRKLV